MTDTHLSEDDQGCWNMLSTAVLLDIVHGRVDPVRLAHEQLAGRGLDLHGAWVGFTAAHHVHDTATD